MTSEFFLHNVILTDFGVDIPITGGTGTSKDPFVICLKDGCIYDSKGTEDVFLLCLGLGRGTDWKLLSRERLEMNGRLLDKIRIEQEVVRDDEEEDEDGNSNSGDEDVATEVRAFYFDVTDSIEQPFKKREVTSFEIVVPDFVFGKVDVDSFIENDAGRSIENPIILRCGIGPNDYVGAEYQYAKLYIKKKFEEAEFNDQALLRVGDREIDRLRYFGICKSEPQYFSFFFDVTDCFGK